MNWLKSRKCRLLGRLAAVVLFALVFADLVDAEITDLPGGHNREIGNYLGAIAEIRHRLADPKIGIQEKHELQLGLAASECYRSNYLQSHRILAQLAEQSLDIDLRRQVDIWKAALSFYEGDYASAASALEPLLRWAKTHSSHRDSGQIYRLAGRLSAALFQFPRARTLLGQAERTPVEDSADFKLQLRIDVALLEQDLGRETEAEKEFSAVETDSAALGKYVQVRAFENHVALAMRRGEYAAAQELLGKGLELARKGGMLAAESRLLCWRANVSSTLESTEKALPIIREAAAKARQAGDLAAETNALRWDAWTHNQRGMIADGTDLYRSALRIESEAGLLAETGQTAEDLALFDIGDDHVVKQLKAAQNHAAICGKLGQSNASALVQIVVASYEAAQGQIPEAQTLLAQVKSYFSSLGGRYQAANGFIQLSYAQSGILGEAPALESAERARRFFLKTGDRYHLAIALNALGLGERQGDPQQAHKDYLAASRLFETLGSLPDIVSSRNNLGSLIFENSQFDEAAGFYSSAIELNNRIGRVNLTINDNLARALMGGHHYDACRRALESELSLARSRHDDDYSAISLTNMGALNIALGRKGEAIGFYREALNVRVQQGNKAKIAAAMRELADYYSGQGSYAEALNWQERSAAGCDATGDTRCKALSLEQRANIFYSWGKYTEALSAFSQSAKLFADLQATADRIRVVGEWGSCLETQGDQDAALELYRRDLSWLKEHGSQSAYAFRLLDESNALSGLDVSTNAARQPALEALRIFQKLRVSSSIGKALDRLSDIEYNAGYLDKALVYANEALHAFQEARSPTGEVEAYSAIASSFRDERDYDDALAALQKRLAIQQQLGFRDGQANSRWRIAEIYRLKSRYVEAVQECAAAVNLAQQRDTIVSALIELGEDQTATELAGAALKNFTKALAIATDSGNLSLEQVALDRRGLLYSSVNQYSQAEADLKASLKLARQRNDPGDTADAYNDLAEVFREEGDFGNAIDYHDLALNIVTKTNPDPQAAAKYLRTKAATLLRSGKGEQALLTVEAGFPFARAADDLDTEVSLLMQKGRILARDSRLGDPKPAFLRALALAKGEGDYDALASVCDDLGDLEVKLNHVAEAQKWYEQSLGWAAREPDGDAEATAELDLGKLFELEGQRTIALQHYLRALDLRESLRIEGRTEDFSVSLNENTAAALRRAVDLMVDGKDFRAAFDLIERFRARSLVDQLSGSLLSLSKDTEGETEEARSIRRQLDRVDGEIGNLPADQPAELLYEKRSKLIDAYEAALRLSDASTSHKGRASLVKSITELQSRIPVDTSLLVYYFARRNAVVFRVQRDGFEGRTIGTPEQVATQVDSACTWSSGFGAEEKAQLKKLEGLLVGQLGPIHARMLGVVPDGVLSRVPFAALWDGRQYLSDRYALFEVPSVNAFSLIRRADARIGNVFVLAQSKADQQQFLPSVTREARDVGSLFRSSNIILNASANDLVQKSRPAYILHVAAHAFVDNQSPWDSRILLREPVMVSDLKQANYPHLELVVLSACETLADKANAAGESISLQRAFFVSGARSVVGSLWKVDDEPTHDLMVAFYRYLLKGEAKAEALSHAERDLRNSYPHPRNWASFVVTGDPGKMVMPPASSQGGYLVLGAMLGALVLGIAIIYLRRIASQRLDHAKQVKAASA